MLYDTFLFFFFFFNDTATTEIYTLSLHDALPIYLHAERGSILDNHIGIGISRRVGEIGRSEEHTSELQSRENLVCRLLLETKKKKIYLQFHIKKKKKKKKIKP